MDAGFYKEQNDVNVFMSESQETDTDNIVEKFNERNLKPYKNLKSMEQNKDFLIIGCRKTKTKYGERLLMELENFNIFLPERYNSLTVAEINKFFNKTYYLRNCGESGRTFKLQIHKVSPSETYSQNAQRFL